uniref:Uncharacterized protein n=1 Tax=Rhizophora mucronata TaxID=61149 RepID=A0A2P2NUV1_RHIMU
MPFFFYHLNLGIWYIEDAAKKKVQVHKMLCG